MSPKLIPAARYEKVNKSIAKHSKGVCP